MLASVRECETWCTIADAMQLVVKVGIGVGDRNVVDVVQGDVEADLGDHVGEPLRQVRQQRGLELLEQILPRAVHEGRDLRRQQLALREALAVRVAVHVHEIEALRRVAALVRHRDHVGLAVRHRADELERVGVERVDRQRVERAVHGRRRVAAHVSLRVSARDDRRHHDEYRGREGDEQLP